MPMLETWRPTESPRSTKQERPGHTPSINPAPQNVEHPENAESAFRVTFGATHATLRRVMSSIVVKDSLMSLKNLALALTAVLSIALPPSPDLDRDHNRAGRGRHRPFVPGVTYPARRRYPADVTTEVDGSLRFLDSHPARTKLTSSSMASGEPCAARHRRGRPTVDLPVRSYRGPH